MKRVKLIVKGKVQGVGFRYFTLNEAKLLSISGYVKNLSNGNVEIDAEGSVNLLPVFIEKIKQGPSFSYIEEVIIEKKDCKGNLMFQILY